MTPLDGFNPIARYYDSLKYLVFGRAIRNSEVHFLGTITSGVKILILGGGSGEILKAILRSDPACRIWYVEASSEMLALAQKQLTPGEKENVAFVHGTQNDLPSDVDFDVVVTNFFLDLFDDKHLQDVCKKVGGRIKTGGVWLVTDFVDGGKWWQRALLWIMYRFFILKCNIEARALPSWQTQLRLCGFGETESKAFYRGFIRSSIFRKR